MCARGRAQAYSAGAGTTAAVVSLCLYARREESDLNVPRFDYFTARRHCGELVEEARDIMYVLVHHPVTGYDTKASPPSSNPSNTCNPLPLAASLSL